jgi:ParB family chromosome partitioning protein
MQTGTNSVFFIEVDKILPNPYQPRREFDQAPLMDLADSIRQYGLLQPLTVSRNERETDSGLVTTYELIAGERRLRASKLAGIREVPCIIRIGDTPMTKLELAIIENVQREDLNAVERARAFHRLADEFKFNFVQIGKKVGKSREYVSNTVRILMLPQDILNALSEGKISEGHTRPLMMLNDRPEEQLVLFKEIMVRRISVREAERIARKIAFDKARKKELLPDPEIIEIEERFQDALGTRVHIETKDVGGKIMIDFFSPEDLHNILSMFKPTDGPRNRTEMLERFVATNPEAILISGETAAADVPFEPMDDRSEEEIKNAEEEKETELYSLKDFSI